MCKPISEIRGKTAQDLLELSEQTDSVPVDLKKLLKKLNISCIAYDFSALEKSWKTQHEIQDENPILGAMVTNGDSAVILYRKKDQEEGHRYRFTIAHELAHVCMSHYSIGDSSIHLAFRKENDANDQQEREANIFAGQLLIPQLSLDRIMRELLYPSLDALADIFAVSRNVMKARLDQLGIIKKVRGYNW